MTNSGVVFKNSSVMLSPESGLLVKRSLISLDLHLLMQFAAVCIL